MKTFETITMIIGYVENSATRYALPAPCLTRYAWRRTEFLRKKYIPGVADRPIAHFKSMKKYIPCMVNGHAPLRITIKNYAIFYGEIRS